jgi:hypothetical protein
VLRATGTSPRCAFRAKDGARNVGRGEQLTGLARTPETDQQHEQGTHEPGAPIAADEMPNVIDDAVFAKRRDGGRVSTSCQSRSARTEV